MTKPREGLFIRRGTCRKVYLSCDLVDALGSPRVRVATSEHGFTLEPWRKAGGGSRSIHPNGESKCAISHAELYRALPEGRLYLLEIGGKFIHHRMLESVA